METKEEVDLTHEDRFEELLHEEIISHGEDRTIQFIAPFEEEDFDENAEIKEGPRVDVMVEVPLSEVNPLSIQSSDSNEELLPDDFLEMDPEPSQVSTGEKRKGAFCIILSVLCLFLFLNSWFIWITPSKEMSPLYVIEDDTPLSLEWWEDSDQAQICWGIPLVKGKKKHYRLGSAFSFS